MTLLAKVFSLFVLVFVSSVHAEVKTIGNPNAVQGGMFRHNLSSAPTTLNALSSTDANATEVQLYILDYLLNKNLDTDEWMPGLATEWSIAKDGMSFEFTLRDGVKWHDGKPFTAEDIKFTFDAIMDKDNKYKTAHMKPYYENIGSIEILAPNKIRANVKTKYFQNFDVIAGGMKIVPKHLYENPTKEQERNLGRTLIGTGPYVLQSFDRSKGITLRKNKDWWGNNVPEYKGMNNFGTILLKFIKETNVQMTSIERGDLDFLAMGAEEFEQLTKGPRWGKDVHKVKMENEAPRGYAFLGMNLRDPIFKSKKVRTAVAHVVNRDMMIEKFLYGYSEPATGPLYKASPYADKNVKPISFDLEKAAKLLAEDGWKDTDGDRILDKMIDGKKVQLKFTILEPLQEFVKYLTIIKEDAKKIGIDIDIKYIEWSSFIKLLDERNFQAVRLAWSAGSVNWDPKQIWHSSSMAAGSNFIGYSNPKVDKLIDEARLIMEKDKRIPALQEVYRTIAEDVPYIFFFNGKYNFYAHRNNLKRVKDTYRYGIGLDYMWLEK